MWLLGNQTGPSAHAVNALVREAYPQFLSLISSPLTIHPPFLPVFLSVHPSFLTSFLPFFFPYSSKVMGFIMEIPYTCINTSNVLIHRYPYAPLLLVRTTFCFHVAHFFNHHSILMTTSCYLMVHFMTFF